MNVQSEPFVTIARNLNALLHDVVENLQHFGVGWPDPKWLQVDSNLPSAFLHDLSETGASVVSRQEIHRQVVNEDGTGRILFEVMRLQTLVQISVLARSKDDRDDVAWRIKQYLIANPQIALVDYTLATPADTGETALFFYRGDNKNPVGLPELYQRDLTFEMQTRVLEAVDAFRVDEIEINQTVGGNPTVTDTTTLPRE